MTADQLQAFLQTVKADAALQAQLQAAADLDAVVAIAKEAGFEISADELQKAQAELSDEDLAGVAGGVNRLFSGLDGENDLKTACDCGMDDCECTHCG